MTQPIEAMITAVSGVVATVSGITQAPNYPPENLNYTPGAITYLISGNLANGPTGTRMDLLTVAIDLFINYDMKLDDAIALLTPFLDLVPAKLQAEVSVQGSGQNGGQFSHTIETFERTVISYIPQTDYAGVMMRGYRFEMQGVKILVNT